MEARAAQLGQTRTALGTLLRHLRVERQLQLWKVGHAAGMDSALLSKIELGQRLPTKEQTAALAKFFAVDLNELEGMRMAERFRADNSHNPAAAALAAARIHESAGEYRVKTKAATASKQAKR
jgi:transcriptional regulator with XRE-family HTH domain